MECEPRRGVVPHARLQRPEEAVERERLDRGTWFVPLDPYADEAESADFADLALQLRLGEEDRVELRRG